MLNRQNINGIIFFQVGPPANSERIPAHKFILATSSSVFFAMFYGGLANADDSQDIEVPDVDPVGFKNLLRYLSPTYELLQCLQAIRNHNVVLFQDTITLTPLKSKQTPHW